MSSEIQPGASNGKMDAKETKDGTKDSSNLIGLDDEEDIGRLTLDDTVDRRSMETKGSHGLMD
jgi:hypothetical protein